MIKKLLFVLNLLFFIISIVGCFSLRENVLVKVDQFEPTITVSGIPLTIHDNILHQYFIRSIVDKKTKIVLHQIYVNYSYDSNWSIYSSKVWRIYNRAYVPKNNLLEIKKIDKYYKCSPDFCRYYEDFGITLSDKYLKEHKNGFTIKASSKSGHDLYLPISAKQISEQLKAIEALP